MIVYIDFGHLVAKIVGTNIPWALGLIFIGYSIFTASTHAYGLPSHSKPSLPALGSIG